jgi:hypothetical protein
MRAGLVDLDELFFALGRDEPPVNEEKDVAEGCDVILALKVLVCQ